MPLARPAAALLSLLSLVSAGCREVAVTGVEPSVVAVGGADVVVSGLGFAEDLALALLRDGTEVTLGGIVVQDEETADAVVPAAAPPGVYDVVARAGGAEDALEDALEVSDAVARFVFIDVGQGDATLVVAPGGETLLIDGGPAGSGVELRAALDLHAGGRLDAVVVSHFDADHLAGVVELLSGPDGSAGTGDDLLPAVRLAPVDDMGCDTATCSRYRALAGYPFETPAVGDALELGEIEAEIVAVDGDLGGGPVSGATDDNERSVVVVLRFAERSVLVAGDLTGGGNGTADLETPLAGRTGPVDVLRTAHHGSITSSASTALSRWAPRLAVFSLGTDNAFCHPHPVALGNVAAVAQRIVSTGAGVVEDVDRCGAATAWPPHADEGLGDVVVDVSADGTITLQGDPL